MFAKIVVGVDGAQGGSDALALARRLASPSAEIVAVSVGVVGRILIGDDARATLRGALCPVAVAPRDYALGDTPIERVGIGWDGESEGDHALDVARSVAEDLGGQVHAVTVIGEEVKPNKDGTPIGRTVTGGDLVPRRSAPGNVELERFAAEVDLMVVGSHQRGPLGRIAVGSASEHLARRSVRPLIVVPAFSRPRRAVPDPADGTPRGGTSARVHSGTVF